MRFFHVMFSRCSVSVEYSVLSHCLFIPLLLNIFHLTIKKNRSTWVIIKRIEVFTFFEHSRDVLEEDGNPKVRKKRQYLDLSF